MQKLSFTAPQHPKKAIKKIIVPIAISRFDVEKYVSSKNNSYCE